MSGDTFLLAQFKVWPQLRQRQIENMQFMFWNLMADFPKQVVSLCLSFILQTKRPTLFLIAQGRCHA